MHEIRARMADMERKDAERDQKAAAERLEMDRKVAAERLEMERKVAAERLEMERQAKADRLDLERKMDKKMAEMERKLAAERREREKIMETLTRTEKKFDRARLKSEAQRKEISRLRLHLPDDQHTQIVEHYQRAPSGSKPIIVMSTSSIAQENAETLVRIHVSLQGTERPARGSSEGPSLDSNALDAGSPASSGGEAKVGNRKGRPNTYSNLAVNFVQITLPGPCRKRGGGVGGTEMSESCLLPKVAAFFTTNVSIRTLAHMTADQLAVAAKEVVAQFEARSGYSYRNAVSGGDPEKPCNVLGYVHRETLTKAINACYLAMDRQFVSMKVVRKADVVTLNFDISGFHGNALLGAVLHLMYIETDGVDAAGHELHTVRSRTICCNTLPVADKTSVDVTREDGTLFAKEVPTRMVEELALSGHLWEIMLHPCTFFGMDRGSECVGAGKGKKWASMRSALLGRGSPLEQIFGTREAVHSAMHGEHATFLRRVLQFLGESDRLSEFPLRALPERPDTSEPILSLPFKLRIKQKAQVPGEAIQFTDEEIGPRVSTLRSALSEYPLIPNCPTGVYCDKHGIDRAGVAWIEKIRPTLKHVMHVISVTRVIAIHKKMNNTWKSIIGPKDTGPFKELHQAAAEALGPERLALLKEQYPKRLPRQEQAAESRWNMVQMTVTDANDKRLLTVVLMIIAVAHGTVPNKILAVQQACSAEGFICKGLIKLPSPKIGRAFYFLNRPAEILLMAVTSLVHVLAFQPLLAAAAHRNECASAKMGGLGSIVRTVDLVLRKLIFCVPGSVFRRYAAKRKEATRVHSATSRHRNEETFSFYEVPKLGHRGVPSIECNGKPVVSSRLEKVQNGSEGKEPPALLHLYGPFYTPSMATAVSRLKDVINTTIRMKAAETEGVLPPELQKLYTGEQKTIYDRFLAAQFLVRHEALSAADCILKKNANKLTNPLALLAAIYDVLPAKVICGDLDEFDDEKDIRIFYYSTDLAIASANVLLVQLSELTNAHGDDLHNFLQDPLKSLVKDCMEELKQFAAADEVDFQRLGTLLPDRHSSERKRFPKPVTAFSRLARLALKAGARPTNTNCVESRWSLLTNKYHAMVRNASARYMSAIFRKRDCMTSNSLGMLTEKEFEENFKAARKFMRKNENGFDAISGENQEESQLRLSRKDPAPTFYADTNIRDSKKDAKAKSGAEKSQKPDKPRQSKRKKSKTKSAADDGKVMSRYEGGTDSNGSSSEPESCGSLKDDGDEPSSNSELSGNEDLQIGGEKAVDDIIEPWSAVDDHDAGGSSSYNDHQGEEDHVQPDDQSGYQLQPCQRGVLDGAAQEASASIDSSLTEGCVREQGAEEHNDSIQRNQPGADLDADDESDAGSRDLSPEFFEDSSEEDGGKEEDEDWSDIAHPFPESDLRKLTADQASAASVWKLEYIWYLVNSTEWKDTEVQETEPHSKSPTLSLTRMDGKKFPLVKGANLFYVLYGDLGLELINVEKITLKVLGSERDDRSLARKKKGTAEQWCIQYTRVLRTESAMTQCTVNDFHVQSNAGIKRRMALGRKSLEALWKHQQQNRPERLVFHKGDFPFETAAKNIVGFVAWDSVPCNGKHDLREFEKQFQKCLASRVSLQIKLSEVDWVFCGEDFSEDNK